MFFFKIGALREIEKKAPSSQGKRRLDQTARWKIPFQSLFLIATLPALYRAPKSGKPRKFHVQSPEIPFFTAVLEPIDMTI